MRAAALAVAVALPALSLAGCGALYDPRGFGTSIGLADAHHQADSALAALARGDNALAEAHATSVLDRDPRNPFALLAAGVAYQNTDRPAEAREMYARILALDTDAVVSGPWWGSRPRLVREVAAENLSRLDDDIRAAGMALAAALQPLGSSAAGPTNAARRFVVLARLRDDGLITNEEYRRRRASNLGALLPLSEQPPAAGLDQPAPQAAQVVARLHALRETYESRSLTAREHADERNAILDSLMPAAPRTRATPASLGSDVESARAALAAVDALRRQGLISAEEHLRERRAIERAAPAVAPPRTAAAPRRPAPAAPAVTPETESMLVAPEGTGNPAAVLRSGRGPLQILPTPVPGSEAELSDGAVLEAAQARSRPPAAPTPKAAAAPKAPEAPRTPDAPSTPNAKPPQTVVQSGRTVPAAAPPAVTQAPSVAASGPVAVHLASFRTRERAVEGWDQLKAQHSVLQGLELRVTEVTLPDQGTFFRLNAGPLPDRGAAEALCRQLAGQYCKPVFGAE